VLCCYRPVASPGDFFVYRERRVAELLAKFLGRLCSSLVFIKSGVANRDPLT
jgi:hypothetical protein